MLAPHHDNFSAFFVTRIIVKNNTKEKFSDCAVLIHIHFLYIISGLLQFKKNANTEVMSCLCKCQTTPSMASYGLSNQSINSTAT